MGIYVPYSIVMLSSSDGNYHMMFERIYAIFVSNSTFKITVLIYNYHLLNLGSNPCEEGKNFFCTMEGSVVQNVLGSCQRPYAIGIS